MLATRRILVPTDFSYGADQALQHALVLAARARAELHLLFVVTAAGYDDWGMVGFAEMEELNARMRREVERHRAASLFGDQLPEPALRCAVRRDADAARAILSYERDHDIDLIVMGTHGRQGAERFRLGSTAEKVVRLAAGSVLTVGTRGRYAPGLTGRILVPVDFSDHAALALRQAKHIAASRHGQLFVLHVVQPVLQPGSRAGAISLERARQPAEARYDLERFYRLAKGPDTAHRFAVVSGQPAAEIAAFAEREDVHLVVQGSRGLSGLDYLLLGSVAADVVRRAPCPVLTVRREPRDVGRVQPAKKRKQTPRELVAL